MSDQSEQPRVADANLADRPVKPCPFCGETGIVCNEASNFRWWAAECIHCGAMSPEVRRNTLDPDTAKTERDVRYRCLAEWNRRAPNGVARSEKG